MTILTLRLDIADVDRTLVDPQSIAEDIVDSYNEDCGYQDRTQTASLLEAEWWFGT